MTTLDVFIVRMNWTEDAVWDRLFLGKDATVAAILHAQVPPHEITAILQCNPEEHTCDDVMEDIARAVATAAEVEQAAGSGGIPVAVWDFIHDHGRAGWARGLKILDRTMAA